MRSFEKPFFSPHLYRASRFLLRDSSSSFSRLSWRLAWRSRTIPPTTPRAEVIPTVPNSMMAIDSILPDSPGRVTSPYPTVQRVCTT